MIYLLDSSAVLAFLWGESGSEIVAKALPKAKVSAVNLTEIAGKMVDRGATDAQARSVIASLNLKILAFDQHTAMTAGLMRRDTKKLGLSIGDRACLAAALAMKLPVLTSDRAWADLDMQIEVELIR